jgi:cytochrome c-type biogenesis protein
VITDVFEVLTEALSGTPAVALAGALAWGVLSVILSPCHLASIPLIIGFIGEQGPVANRRAFLLSLLFSSGILVTIAIVGVATAALGRMIGDLGAGLDYAVAAIFFVMGLHFLGILPIPLSAADAGSWRRRGLLASFTLGLVFGLALGPCTFAFMAPMLGIALSLAGADMGYGVMLLVAYGIGHCAVIVAAGTFTGLVERYLKWTSSGNAVAAVKRICGMMLILAGVYVLWKT